MVGIAAGIGSEKGYGNIIAASEVWNYVSGKYVDNENNTVFLPDPKYIGLDPKIDGIFRNDFDEVLYNIKKKWSGTKINNDLKIIVGPLACGTAVIGSTEIVEDMISSHARKTVGLDMESYGVFYACKYGSEKKPIAICLKSISDFADTDKSDRYQEYAAYTSASFSRYLIGNYFVNEDIIQFIKSIPSIFFKQSKNQNYTIFI